jgi:predicted permease
MLTDVLYRLRALFRSEALDRELDEELRFHLERQIDAYVASGLPPDEAARRARLMFGGAAQIAEECRDARGIAAVETVVQDLRYGLRTLRRAPVFSVTAILTIALSTAALATALTLGHTMLFRQLPVDRPDEIVVVSATRGQPSPEGPVSYPDYVAFRDGARTLSGLAAHYPTAPLFVTVDGDSREINGAVVSANFFPLLGIQPALGRFFTPAEDQVPDRDRVAVVSHDLWRTAFASSPDALGRSVKINGVDFTVIGVAPAAFKGIKVYPAEIFIPTMMLRVGYRWCDDSLSPTCTILDMLGRLAPGRAPAEAAAELTTLMPASWRHAPKGENSGIAVARAQGVTSAAAEKQLAGILAGVAIVLLLVCCANLAGLLTAQGAARSREFTVRLSIGAGRARVVRQFMTESLLLSVTGGVGGVLLSRGFVSILAALFYALDDEGHPLYYDFSLTPAIVVAGVAASVLAGCLFSAIPAIRIARTSAIDRLEKPWTAGPWLVGAQAAMAVALMAVAALLTTSARRVVNGTSFESSHVALMRLRPRLVKYTPERAQRFQREAVQRLAAVLGVESVSMVGVGAVLGGGGAAVSLPGWTASQRVRVGYNEIGPRYFETLRAPLLGGREFDDHDSPASPRVAIVTATLARRLWTDRSPIGATITVGDTPHQVVGVVTDVQLQSRAETIRPFVYVPFWQNPAQVDSRLCIRVAGDPAAMLPALAREVNRVDPDVPIAEIITLPIQMAGWVRPARISAAFVGYAAALATLLTAIGLYGTLAFAVSRRTKEIGIRMALGAARARVLALIVREGMIVVAAGVVAGLGLAAAGSRIVTHLLYGSASADWIFHAAAAVLVSLVGLLASLVPARRAAAVEPLVALRHE